MYAGIDIGAADVIARFDNRGVMIASEKFPTPHDYDQFIENLGHTLPRLGKPSTSVAPWLSLGGLTASMGLGWSSVTSLGRCTASGRHRKTSYTARLP